MTIHKFMSIGKLTYYKKIKLPVSGEQKDTKAICYCV